MVSTQAPKKSTQEKHSNYAGKMKQANMALPTRGSQLTSRTSIFYTPVCTHALLKEAGHFRKVGRVVLLHNVADFGHDCHGVVAACCRSCSRAGAEPRLLLLLLLGSSSRRCTAEPRAAKCRLLCSTRTWSTESRAPECGFWRLLRRCPSEARTAEGGWWLRRLPYSSRRIRSSAESRAAERRLRRG